MKQFLYYLLLFAFIFTSCSDSNTPEEKQPIDNTPKEISIFCVNDVHGQIDNFAKLKYIVDKEREEHQVVVVSAGDLFSGNPVVDNHPEKGYPMVDLMNKSGFDIAVLGNHEFDYGLENLKNRFTQSEFDWICANVNTENSPLPQPLEYKTITKDDIKLTFLGLVETNGKDDAIIPSTHPWRVKEITFQKPQDVVALYSDLKSEEDADLYICLSHLGMNGNDQVLGDIQLANQFPFFDLIIGGHSHQKVNTVENGVHIVQSGGYLNYLGKINLVVTNKKIEEFSFELIDLNNYAIEDTEIKNLIADYNNQDYLTEVIGYSNRNHGRSQVGCFYTDALRNSLQVDLSFQNTGGVRSSLNQGDITTREIYEISPFNNGTVIYEMSVLDIKKFLKESGAGFYYSGVELSQNGQDVIIKDVDGKHLEDEQILRVGLNDYIPAVHDTYFPETGTVQELTDAETIIEYLRNNNSPVDYPNAERYFRMK
ncbi:bifunctional metallophosphatase/5'-nucleotidase [Marinifilum caeruleilacunae]|uniref:Bifunctional metallophosphatase/5'-nucleotidase n=1 Tax=Marinifilum caeruleilacunae TaxID=2499076 RepID=A0ABX1WTL2_9BACT|nr:bifunctional UDP-sugar hydrolase/5'-nucleotidase [Marinifilum caeruleilacunae]NOU59258.1 bifunctional metallophosphatase/5'-nucleotidase [Marinifilum caeruleilacunae]